MLDFQALQELPHVFITEPSLYMSYTEAEMSMHIITSIRLNHLRVTV